MSISCVRCHSYAINHSHHGRDGSDRDLCDVCYWRKRASDATTDKLAGLLREVQADTKVGLTLGEAQNLYSSIDAALAAYDAERNAK